jgi:hypothetical protein
MFLRRRYHRSAPHSVPGAMEAWRTKAPRRQEVYISFLFRLLSSVLFEMLRQLLHLKVTMRSSPRPILAPVVRLALAEGAWSCVSRGSPWIMSVSVPVGVVWDLSLLIYGSHLWWWLLLWCALCGLSTTTFCLYIATSSRTTSLICLTLVTEMSRHVLVCR